uniref:RRM domain-containing protein n=1 Tax=Lactuca sativa TaxID=4236 RepID=A0A9R1X0U6_LACSA|nr:hypothetical protein LSAT_V11C800404340 [Lactuca sativa]
MSCPNSECRRLKVISGGIKRQPILLIWNGSDSNREKIEKLSVTDFVTNFPNDLVENDLWHLFEEFGKIADVYIARKLSKNGRKFAFVIYLNAFDGDRLEKRLAYIWAGSFHLFVSVAKFKRGEETKLIEKVMKKIIIHVSDLHVVDDSRKVTLGRIKDAFVIPTLYHLCLAEGFDDVQINNVTKNFVVKECAKWIEINGLPLSAWSAADFKKVANVFGRVLFTDEALDEHISCGKVCIVAPVSGLINENLLVEVEGLEYNIHVKEIDVWCPDIDKVLCVGQGESQRKDDKFLHEEEEEEGSDKDSINGDYEGDCNDFLNDNSLKENDPGNDKNKGFRERDVEDSCSDKEDNNREEVKEGMLYTKQLISLLPASIFTSSEQVNEIEKSGEDVNKSDDSAQIQKRNSFNSIKGKGDHVGNNMKATDGCQNSSSASSPLGFNHQRFHSPIRSGDSSVEKKQSFNASVRKRKKKYNIKSKYVPVGSLTEVMEKYVEFGKVLGYDFTRCKEDIGSIIESQDVQQGFK